MVFKAHSSDQVAHLFADPRSAPERTGLPSPISGKARSMPTHNRLGSDDRYRVKYARAATIEPDEQSAVDPAQMQSAWRPLLEDIELMPQDQDFSFQPPSRLEAVPHHTDEEEGDCDHQPQSCSDSVASVTPADWVFGSDNPPSWLANTADGVIGAHWSAQYGENPRQAYIAERQWRPCKQVGFNLELKGSAKIHPHKLYENCMRTHSLHRVLAWRDRLG
jgi:hypothetical protein